MKEIILSFILELCVRIIYYILEIFSGLIIKNRFSGNFSGNFIVFSLRIYYVIFSFYESEIFFGWKF